MHLKKNETKGIIAITAVALFVAVSLHAQFVGAEDRTASQDYAPIELSDVDIASRLKPLLARLQGHATAVIYPSSDARFNCNWSVLNSVYLPRPMRFSVVSRKW